MSATGPLSFDDRVTGFAAAVQDSGFGRWAAESALAYPLANTLHLLGLVMLVGGIGVLDLRLAGFFRALPLAPLSGALTPIAIGGLVVLVPTGFTMFAADARTLVGSTTFQLKLLLILLALGNALAVRWIWRGGEKERSELPPTAIRVMAICSIGLWLAVAALGRWIAYS